MNIVLIGFASSGKSATGRALCKRAGMRYIDLDRVIEDMYEQRHGSHIPCREIFKNAGAEGFSLLENEALLSLSNMRKSVLSTGGRTPVYEPNQPLLRSLGRIVYLKCDAETALGRMKNKGIPLSMGGTPESVAEEWNKRAPIYAKIAEITVDNDNISPDDTAKTIIDKLSI